MLYLYKIQLKWQNGGKTCNILCGLSSAEGAGVQGCDSFRLLSPLSILCRGFLQGGDLLMSFSSPLPSRETEATRDHICSRASSRVFLCSPVSCLRVRPGTCSLPQCPPESTSFHGYWSTSESPAETCSSLTASSIQSEHTTETETLNVHPESQTPALL